MQILNTNSSGKSYTANEDSTIGLVSDDDEILSFDRSVINNQDFLLSSSFNNMYKKNGLHIEEGQVGRLVPYRPVASGGAGGPRAPPLFVRSVNPISTRGWHIIPTQYYVPPGFSDLATALLYKQLELGRFTVTTAGR